MASRTDAALCAKVRTPRTAMISFPSRVIQLNHLWSRSIPLTSISAQQTTHHKPSTAERFSAGCRGIPTLDSNLRPQG
jgi:hypothetical protein